MALATRETPLGFELPSVTKQITQEKMNRFANLVPLRCKLLPSPIINQHTSEEFARSVGFPGTMTEGLHLFAYISEILTSFFAEGWLEGGKLEVSFLKMVRPGDTVTAKGVVKEKTAEDSALRVLVEVWCENQHGEKVAAGTASGLVR